MSAEVEQTAEHLSRQHKCFRNTREERYKIVKDLMKHKLLDVEKCIKRDGKELQ